MGVKFKIITNITIFLLMAAVAYIWMIYPQNSQFQFFTNIHELSNPPFLSNVHFYKQKKYTNSASQSSIQNPIQKSNSFLIINISKSHFFLSFQNKTIIDTQKSFIKAYQNQQYSITQVGQTFFSFGDKQNGLICIHQIIDQIRQFPDKIEIKGRFQDCQSAITYIIVIEIQQKLQNNAQLLIKSFIVQKQNQQITKINRIGFTFWKQNSEKFYGLGQQFSHLILQDKPYSLVVRQKGIGRTEQPLTFLTDILHQKGGSYYHSYAPAPIWFSSRYLAYSLNTTNYMIWKSNNLLIWGNSFKIRIISAQKNYKDLIKRISFYNGYVGPVHNWINKGAIVGLQGGTGRILQIYAKLKQFNCSISGIWIQDWVSKRMSLGYSRLWWNWQLDEDWYPNWNQMRKKLIRDNVNILTYINPMLTNVLTKINHKNNLFQQAKSKKFLVQISPNQPYLLTSFSDFQAGLIDVYNPKAKQFYKKLIKKFLIQTSPKGMMVDFGEGYPLFPQSFSQKQRQMYFIRHNKYSNQWFKLVKQCLIEHFGQKNDFFVFTRSGYLNSPSYTNSLWAGDQNMNFGRHNGLKSCLVAILSSGLVGYSNTHCDIGGYVYIPSLNIAVRTEDLLIRWMQLASFTGVFRTHEGNKPQDTLQVYSNQRLLKAFSFYSLIFKSLSNYRKYSYSKGQYLPLARPLFVEYPNVKQVQQIWDQYMLGNDILVNPILEENSKKRQMYFPKQVWINVWNGERIQGCGCKIWRENMIMGLDLPIVFIKQSSRFLDQILSNFNGQLKRYKQIQNDKNGEL